MRIAMLRHVIALGALGLVLLVAACGRTVDDPMEEQSHTVRGVARYADPLPLSVRATLVGRLHDLSRGEGEVLVEKQLAPPGQIPIPFELSYRGADVSRDAELAVTVEIRDDGELLFVTEAPVRVNRGTAVDIVEVTLTPTEEARARIEALQDEDEGDEFDDEPPAFNPDLVPDANGEGGATAPEPGG
jgi:uncharacterized lipoprotein YbaY